MALLQPLRRQGALPGMARLSRAILILFHRLYRGFRVGNTLARCTVLSVVVGATARQALGAIVSGCSRGCSAAESDRLGLASQSAPVPAQVPVSGQR